MIEAKVRKGMEADGIARKRSYWTTARLSSTKIGGHKLAV